MYVWGTQLSQVDNEHEQYAENQWLVLTNDQPTFFSFQTHHRSLPRDILELFTIPQI